MARVDDNGGRGTDGRQIFNQKKSVASAHNKIGDDDIGRPSFGEGARLIRSRRFGANPETRMVAEQQTEADQDDGMVVDRKNLQGGRHAHLSNGAGHAPRPLGQPVL